MSLSFEELKSFLDEKVDQYNTPAFIAPDPISIPHQFHTKKDIEISGFLAASIAWGKREMILKSSHQMMEAMDNNPYEFVVNYDVSKDFKYLEHIKHRTFNAQDLSYFISALQYCYRNFEDLEAVFSSYLTPTTTDMKAAIVGFRTTFFIQNKDEKFRTFKHVSNPDKGSAAKRINMFLRWMVRKDTKGVDFGIWDKISPALLSCPLDVHSGNVARSLSLIERQQNDWKALTELDNNLRKLDSTDPAKYDFALFGLGINEQFK